jgi:DNA polymerase-1
MALIGEAPGAEEEIQGRPFVGTAGNILNLKLHKIGVSRQQCYITNVVKVRPTGNDFSVFWKGTRPKPELWEWRNKLLEELDELQTNIFVPLGSNALWALTGQTKIGKYRGSIMSCTLPSGRVVKVIGTYHPAAVAREWKLGAIMIFDLTKALKESASPEINLPNRNLIIAPTLGDTINYLSLIPNSSAFSYDIETSYSGIECISFSYFPESAISIPTTIKYWGSLSIIRSVIELINGALINNNVIKVGQNISFDIQYLMRVFNILPSKPWADTMIMSHSCYSELPKALDFLTSIYTNEPYYKDDLKLWRTGETTDETLWRYNAKDAAVTLECYYELLNEMDELNVRGTYDFMMELLEPLLFMMVKGVRVDTKKIEEYKKTFLVRLSKSEGLFKQKYGDINVNSPKQLMGLVDKLGLKCPTKDGKPTTNKEAIEKLAIKSPEFKEVLGVRESRKLISTYLESEVDAETGRWHCSFNSTGTETYRLSSSEGVFKTGGNMQNIPTPIRDIVIPDDSMIFTNADLIGAEAMIVAYITNDPLLINLFQEGKNIHIFTANMIWGLSEEEVKDDKDKCESGNRHTESKYFKAKRIRHSGNYLASWMSLMHQLKIPAYEAKKLLQKFYDASPNLVKWHYEIADKLKRDRTIVTPTGRKRIFFGRYSSELIRQVVAFIPQETVVTVLNQGIINIYNTLCKEYRDVEVLLQVHDSVLIQHSPDKVDYIHKRLKELMKVDLTINGRTFYIPVEIKSGYNWRDLKKNET